MRVRPVGSTELPPGLHLVTARYGSIHRAAGDEGYQCSSCSFVLELVAAVACDPKAAFRCPQCGERSVRVD